MALQDRQCWADTTYVWGSKAKGSCKAEVSAEDPLGLCSMHRAEIVGTERTPRPGGAGNGAVTDTYEDTTNEDGLSIREDVLGLHEAPGIRRQPLQAARLG